MLRSKRAIAQAQRLMCTLRADARGLAFVEFALVLPLFLLVVCSGLEIASYARAQLRVSEMAMAVADNAGRVMGGIDEANIHEVFAGADAIGEGIDFAAHGRLVLSSVEDNGNNGSKRGQMIRWQRCWGEGDFAPAYGEEGAGTNDASLAEGLGPEGKSIGAADGTAIMFVEASYTYQPLILGAFFDDTAIRYESAFNVRGRENQVLTNVQGLSAMRCD